MASLDAMTIRLHLGGTRVLEVVEALPERLVVAVSAIASVIRCGRCGAKTNRMHATKKAKVADLAHGGRPTTLVWHRRRFRCRSCRATTTESHPLFAGRMTTRLARAVVRDCQNMTVSAVSALRVALAQGDGPGAGPWGPVGQGSPAPAHSGAVVDEKAMRKGHNSFSTILTDGDRGRVIAVIEGRSAEVLGTWLARQSPRWRSGVKVVVTDMAECYRKAVRKHLPHARHVADRFHVVRNFSKALVSARRDAHRTSRGKPHVPSVFHARFLLMKRCDRLSGEDVARLGAIFDANPELGVVWGLVQRFHVIFCAPDEEAANRAVDNLTDAYQEAGVNLGAAVKLSLGGGDPGLPPHRPGYECSIRRREQQDRVPRAHGLRLYQEGRLRGPCPARVLRPSSSRDMSRPARRLRGIMDVTVQTGLLHPLSRRTARGSPRRRRTLRARWRSVQGGGDPLRRDARA